MTPDDKNTIFSFDAKKYPFHEIVAACVGTRELDGLRAGLAPAAEGTSLYRNMEDAEAFRALYAGLDGAQGEAFAKTYLRFLREVIAPQYPGDEIYYQVRPSHRILFSDTPGASRYHRDRDYGHHRAEVNYWVPQTRAFATNSMWVESAEGAADFAPADLAVGQYLRFDGANFAHGAHVNETGKTRISFDFRVVPASLADEDIRTSDARAQAAVKTGNPVRDNARHFRLLEA